jgi:hypothetical protein
MHQTDSIRDTRTVIESYLGNGLQPGQYSLRSLSINWMTPTDKPLGDLGLPLHCVIKAVHLLRGGSGHHHHSLTFAAGINKVAALMRQAATQHRNVQGLAQADGVF